MAREVDLGINYRTTGATGRKKEQLEQQAQRDHRAKQDRQANQRIRYGLHSLEMQEKQKHSISLP